MVLYFASDTTLTFRRAIFTRSSAKISFVTDEDLDTPEIIVNYDPSLQYLIDQAFPKQKETEKR